MPKKPVVMNHQSIIWPDIFEGFSGPKHDQFANVVWKHCRILRARSKKSWRLRWLGTWKGGNSAKCGGGGLRFWGISGGRGFTRKWLVYQHQILVRNGIGCQNASESWFMWLSNTHLRVETAHEATLEGTEAKKNAGNYSRMIPEICWFRILPSAILGTKWFARYVMICEITSQSKSPRVVS